MSSFDQGPMLRLALAMMKVIEEERLDGHTTTCKSTLSDMSSLPNVCDLCPCPNFRRPAMCRRTQFNNWHEPLRLRSQRRSAWALAFSAVAVVPPQYGQSPVLPAQTGAWREVGGGLCNFWGAMFTAQDMGKAMRFDLSPPGTREINMVRLAEHLLDPSLDPPIKVIYNYNCNPAASLPDQPALRRALQRPDLFTVVHDIVSH